MEERRSGGAKWPHCFPGAAQAHAPRRLRTEHVTAEAQIKDTSTRAPARLWACCPGPWATNSERSPGVFSD